MNSKKYHIFKDTFVGDLFLGDDFSVEQDTIFFGKKFSGFSTITVGTVQPASPEVGDLWIDTN